MKKKVDCDLIKLKLNMIRNMLGKDFIKEYHSISNSFITIAINHKYNIYKCVLETCGYKVDKNNPSKFIWTF